MEAINKNSKIRKVQKWNQNQNEDVIEIFISAADELESFFR